MVDPSEAALPKARLPAERQVIPLREPLRLLVWESQVRADQGLRSIEFLVCPQLVPQPQAPSDSKPMPRSCPLPRKLLGLPDFLSAMLPAQSGKSRHSPVPEQWAHRLRADTQRVVRTIASLARPT